AGFENQKELTKMQLDNQKEIAEMQNETQKEIAGIQSATSRQNTKDQVYAQNEMLAYQQKESTARVASIMENTNLSKQQQVSRSEERFSRNAETDLVCRLLLEKKKKKKYTKTKFNNKDLLNTHCPQHNTKSHDAY